MRIFVTILAYNHHDMVRGALENFESITTDFEHRRLIKTIFLCQYPLPSIDENREKIISLAEEFGWWHSEIPNEGGLSNHNKVIHDFYHMRNEDYYVCFDPDVRIQQKGWISASVEALQSDPNIVFVCAARPFHDEKWCEIQHGRSIYCLPSGLRVAKYRELIAWSTGVWKGNWLASRPRNFSAINKFYGYFEHADLDLMKQHGKTWISLVDYYDHHQSACPEYTQWKIDSAQHKTNESFETWLKGAT